MTTALSYLSRLCRRWGGSLDLLSRHAFGNLASTDMFSLHPSGSHAIDRHARRIIAERHRVNAGTVIHEMGHVFLAEGDKYEPDWLGWEIALARRARCYLIWSKQNHDYNVQFDEHDKSWSEFSALDRKRLISDRIDYAKSIGIVSQDGAPLCTRQP